MGQRHGTVAEARPQGAGLSPTDARAVQQAGPTVELAPGSVLFTQGESAGRLYVVVTGRVKLIRDWPGPRAAVVAVRGPDDLFVGLSSIGCRTWTETAVALSAARLTMIELHHLSHLLARRPSLRLAVLQAAAHEWREADSRLADVAFIDVRARVAAQLLQFANLHGAPVPDSTRVRYELTQRELAQLVGASRASVDAALADFVHQGWLRRERGAAVLIDPPALVRIARHSRLLRL